MDTTSKVIYSNQNINLNLSKDLQQSSTFKHRMVTVLSYVANLIPLACVTMGAITGWWVAEKIGDKIDIDQGRGESCYSETNSALRDSRNRAHHIAVTTTVISSLVSPLIYSVYNSKMFSKQC